nr:MAG TPA: hypothetical protein [Caudoviricetes sp.]
MLLNNMYKCFIIPPKNTKIIPYRKDNPRYERFISYYNGKSGR